MTQLCAIAQNKQESTAKLAQLISQGEIMSLGTLLLIVLILMLLGVIPTWPHSRRWGYMPSTGIGLLVLIIVVLLLTGRL